MDRMSTYSADYISSPLSTIAPFFFTFSYKQFVIQILVAMITGIALASSITAWGGGPPTRVTTPQNAGTILTIFFTAVGNAIPRRGLTSPPGILGTKS